MAKLWDSDDKLFVLVLLAAVISQTATHKNVLGATAQATVALFERTLNEPAPTSQRKPVAAIRRSSSLWAGTVAFFKSAVTGIARREKPASAQTPSTLSFLRRSWHVPSQKPLTPAPKTWRIGLDRVHWPWKKRTPKPIPMSTAADPRLAAALQPPRI